MEVREKVQDTLLGVKLLAQSPFMSDTRAKRHTVFANAYDAIILQDAQRNNFGDELEVVSVNVSHLEDPTTQKALSETLSRNPDFVILQEARPSVVLGLESVEGYNVIYLENEVYFAKPGWMTQKEWKTLPEKDKHSGNMILARGKIVNQRTIVGAWPEWSKDIANTHRQWNAIAVDVYAGGKMITAGASHNIVYDSPPARKKQTQRFVGLTGRLAQPHNKGPAFLGFDANAICDMLDYNLATRAVRGVTRLLDRTGMIHRLDDSGIDAVLKSADFEVPLAGRYLYPKCLDRFAVRGMDIPEAELRKFPGSNHYATHATISVR